MLSKEQIARYSRQLILPEIGPRGQKKLLDASALIVGAGGLGSPAALYLAAAGVGRLGVIDYDTVSLSNLHRQILHHTASVGRPKGESAKERLQALNPDVQVEAIACRLEPENVLERIRTYDLVLDGSDNFTTRYLVNDACVLSQTPFLYGGVVCFMGQVMVVRPKSSACFRCLFPEPPSGEQVPNCQEAGILGAVAGILGTVMAHEALKLLLEINDGLTDRLLVFDGLKSRFREVPVRRDPTCAVCGEAPTIRNPETVKEQACVSIPESEVGNQRSEVGSRKAAI